MKSTVRYGSLFLRLLANSVESETYSYEGTCCWEWTGRRIRRGGYGYVALRVPGKPNPQGHRAHRVMAELVLRRQLHPDLETLEHACGITWCINPLHLRLASRADNSADMRARKTGKGPRRVFKPLVDPDLYVVDRFIRSLPVLKSTLNSEEIPF